MACLPMASRSNEVETAVDASVLQHIAHHSRFPVQKLLILRVDVLDDWVPTGGREGRHELGNHSGLTGLTSWSYPPHPQNPECPPA